jgi:hypothetical protein
MRFPALHRSLKGKVETREVVGAAASQQDRVALYQLAPNDFLGREHGSECMSVIGPHSGCDDFTNPVLGSLADEHGRLENAIGHFPDSLEALKGTPAGIRGTHHD